MDPERPINAIDCENLSLERILKKNFRQLRNDRNTAAEILFGYITQALNCREIDLQTLQTLLHNLWLAEVKENEKRLNEKKGPGHGRSFAQSKALRFWL